MVKVNLHETPFVILPSHLNPGNLLQLYFYKKVLIISLNIRVSRPNPYNKIYISGLSGCDVVVSWEFVPQLDALLAFNKYNFFFNVRIDGTGLTASVSLKFHRWVRYF